MASRHVGMVKSGLNMTERCLEEGRVIPRRPQLEVRAVRRLAHVIQRPRGDMAQFMQQRAAETELVVDHLAAQLHPRGVPEPPNRLQLAPSGKARR